MRRSPFGFGGSNMGGGRGGNIHMLRSIQRVCKAGEAISRSPRNSTSSTTTTTAGGKYSDNKNKSGNSSVLTLSSSTSPRKTSATVVATTWPSCPSPTLTEESDGWEFIDGIDNDSFQQTYFDDAVFGRPPSSDEVQQAFHSLQGSLSYSDKGVAYQVFSPTGSLGGDSPFGGSADWEEPSPHLCNSRMLSPRRLDQGDVYNALSLLQKDHDIQQIVESISTDEAVWDAVKNNGVVCELRRAYLQADINSAEGSNGNSVEGSDGDSHSGDSNGARDILSWFVAKVRSKIMELMQNITKTLDQLLGSGTEAEKNVDQFDKKVKLSLVVTVALFLAVVLQRMKLAGNSST